MAFLFLFICLLSLKRFLAQLTNVILVQCQQHASYLLIYLFTYLSIFYYYFFMYLFTREHILIKSYSRQRGRDIIKLQVTS